MSPDRVASEIEIDPARVDAWRGEDAGLQLVDVREPYERDAGHIAATSHIPLAELSGAADTLDHQRPVVFYCRSGVRSLMAAQAFRAAGIEAYSMAGGLVRWEREARPLSPEGGHVANH